MDLETLFTTSKWEILEKIAQQPMSPLQLSSSLHTSPANVSQQVKLLQIAGLLEKEKVPTRETGKPRALFSLKDDFSYLISVAKEGARKGLIPTDAKKRLILNSWMADDAELEQMAFDLATVFREKFDAVGGVAWDPTHHLLFLVIDDKESAGAEIESMRDSTLRNHHHLQVLDRKRFISLLEESASDQENSRENQDNPIQLLVIDSHMAEQIRDQHGR
ncbi:MAG: helix-turn-helix transcriptional regulator [DPANN group archaeon]|nr:helix-turn-helix transcriptional regulator [DPANN group archaeon]